MPIVFTHFLLGVVVLGAVWLIYRSRLTHPLFYLWGVSTFMLPDLNYIAIWKPSMGSEILPTAWEDLFAGLFVPHEPFLLHFWGFPIIFAGLTVGAYVAGWRQWKYLASLATGWTVHLVMDGVMFAW